MASTVARTSAARRVANHGAAATSFRTCVEYLRGAGDTPASACGSSIPPPLVSTFTSATAFASAFSAIGYATLAPPAVPGAATAAAAAAATVASAGAAATAVAAVVGSAVSTAAAAQERRGRTAVLLDSLNLPQQLNDIRAAGTWKEERVISTPQGPIIALEDGRGGEVLNFCANNYLGLSAHPAVVSAAKHALESHGFGMSSVRFICGTQDLHTRLERRLAQFHATEDAILFPSCFDANAGLFEAVLTAEDAVLSDELNHASIIDGIRLCKAQRLRYRHSDMDDLESKLKEAQAARVRLIATDGVFSMQGDIALLPDICFLAQKYNALVFVDDAHATGFLGKTGRGTSEFYGMDGSQVHILNSTLGKALGGGTGGYTAGSRALVELLRQKARPYLFSNSLSPLAAAAGLAALDLISADTSLRDKLAANTAHFRNGMAAAGFEVLPPGGQHPIVPVMLGDARLAHTMADRLLDRGIYVIGFSYPVVPKETARIRVQISAAHTPQQIEACVDAFSSVGRELGIL